MKKRTVSYREEASCASARIPRQLLKHFAWRQHHNLCPPHFAKMVRPPKWRCRVSHHTLKPNDASGACIDTACDTAIGTKTIPSPTKAARGGLGPPLASVHTHDPVTSPCPSGRNSYYLGTVKCRADEKQSMPETGAHN